MKALVTGGGGFLGRSIVTQLLEQGHSVTSVSRGRYPELEELGARVEQLSLCDRAAVDQAVPGHDTLFHVAAKTGIWGTRDSFFRTNVEGTRNVLEAALRHGVQRLVYTSSPSVCFDGRSHRRAAGDLPYAKHYLCPYPETKALAEQLILRANRKGGLATTALRPHLIFGPGDPHLLPRLLDRGRRGRLAIVGRGDNEVSLTYIDNAAAAHLDAARSLTPDAPHAGRAYFIGQEEPVALWSWINHVFEELEIQPVRRRVPRALAYGAGGALELAWRLLGLNGEPPMTRFVASQLATDHSYDLEPARRDFGYSERVDLDRATERTIAALR